MYWPSKPRRSFVDTLTKFKFLLVLTVATVDKNSVSLGQFVRNYKKMMVIKQLTFGSEQLHEGC